MARRSGAFGTRLAVASLPPELQQHARESYRIARRVFLSACSTG
jgi:hypothetical protein